MPRNLLAAAFLAAMVSFAAGDALILNDGRKLIGRVAEKADHYELTVEGQQIAFAKDDVKQWIRSPKEVVGDADKLVTEAKQLYLEAVEIKDEKAAEAKFREALPRVTKAREAYAEARDIFPEGHSNLDASLVEVMKLMRLVRERIGSQIASGAPVIKVKEEPPPAPKAEPPPPPKPEPPPAPEFGIRDAWAIAVDPAARADEARRGQARAFFRKAAEARAPFLDLHLAAVVVLSRKPEATGPAQEFLKALGAGGLEALPEKESLAALKALAAKLKAMGPEAAGVEAPLLAAGVAGALLMRAGGKPTPEIEALFKELGYEKSEYSNVWGRREALALDEYRRWVASGEYSLGVVQFQNDFRGVPDRAVRYALGLLMIFKAMKDNRNYNRAAAYLEGEARSVPAAAAEHMRALAKSVREESPCMACSGTHKINCSACKGKTKLNLECGGCGGSGKVNNFKGIVTCRFCNGVGIFRNKDCPKCKATGKAECKARGCTRAVPPPTFDSFADAYKCAPCKGKGSLLAHVAFPCPDCSGLGMVLQPKADPSKLFR
jgi:hypothetical protein